MRMITVSAFLFLVLLGAVGPVRADQFDRGMAAAHYMDDYQSGQARGALVRKGLILLFLAAGGAALAFKMKSKK